MAINTVLFDIDVTLTDYIEFIKNLREKQK